MSELTIVENVDADILGWFVCLQEGLPRELHAQSKRLRGLDYAGGIFAQDPCVDVVVHRVQVEDRFIFAGWLMLQ